MAKKIVIIGASGHGRVIADIAKINGYDEILFLDDNTEIKTNGSYQVVGTSETICRLRDYDVIIGIGNNTIREKIAEKIAGYKIVTLIHPSAIIDDTVEIEEGTVVMANAVINANAHIKKHCIVNTSATIDHDCVIDDFCHVSPGAHIAGTVNIGNKSWVGIGASVVNNINITHDVVVGAGSVVIKDIQDSGTYVGVPVRKIK